MSRLPDGERIAALEVDMRHLIKRIDAMNVKMDTVMRSLDEMSGGKRALLGMFALIGSAVGVIGTLFGMHLFGK